MIALATSTLLMSCREVELQNGRYPASESANVSPLAGEFVGQTEITSSIGPRRAKTENIHLRLDSSEQTLRLTSDTDLAGTRCDSQIGKLKRLAIEDHKVWVAFEFNPGKCSKSIHGNSLSGWIDRDDKRYEFYFTIHKGTVSSGGKSPSSHPVNITGRFYKPLR